MFVERGLVLVQPYAERPVVDQGAAQAEPETVAGPVALKSVAGAVDWVGPGGFVVTHLVSHECITIQLQLDQWRE